MALLTTPETQQAGSMDGRLDDYSKTFHTLRAKLTDSKANSYIAFVRSLRPDYGRVYRDIGLGYGMLLASLGISHWLSSSGVPALATIVGALLVGYWVAYLQLFVHEGAHFNLARRRDMSDRLCNRLISWMVGASVQQYRRVHFQHHRALGTVHDSEFTYFFPLNILFLVKTLFGIRALEVALRRRTYLNEVAMARSNREPENSSEDGLQPSSSTVAHARTDQTVFIAGILVHAMIVGVCWLLGGFVLALVWILGIGMFFPFFGALRQLLEHRDDAASAAVDYSKVDHGAFTRMFGGLFSSTFGGAGFNRHLLHHWEPQVSYTNLAELEAFLADTPMRPIMDARRASYIGTFVKLLSLR